MGAADLLWKTWRRYIAISRIIDVCVLVAVLQYAARYCFYDMLLLVLFFC